jgi:hypothetical protein
MIKFWKKSAKWLISKHTQFNNGNVANLMANERNPCLIRAKFQFSQFSTHLPSFCPSLPKLIWFLDLWLLLLYSLSFQNVVVAISALVVQNCLNPPRNVVGQLCPSAVVCQQFLFFHELAWAVVSLVCKRLGASSIPGSLAFLTGACPHNKICVEPLNTCGATKGLRQARRL